MKTRQSALYVARHCHHDPEPRPGLTGLVKTMGDEE